MFGSFGIPELFLILGIVIILFGAGRIAGIGKALGQSVRGFREEVHTGIEGEEGEESEDGEGDEASADIAASSDAPAEEPKGAAPVAEKKTDA